MSHPFPSAALVGLAGLLLTRATFAQSPPRPAEPAPDEPSATMPRRIDSLRPRVMPGLRVGFGAHVPINPATPADVGFVFDLHAGVGLYPSRDEAGLALVPELGYSHAASGPRGGNFFTPGLLLMVGSWLVSFGVAEHAVIGDAWGAEAYGVRSSLIAQVLATSLTLEVGHQWTSVGGEDRHDFRVSAAINPIPLVRAILWRASRLSR